MSRAEDTICAPATSAGGAICVIRVSGSGCFAAVDAVVRMRRGSAASAKGFSVHFGEVEGLDEVLVCVFRAPQSYTGEDMAEISCHASPYVVSEMLRRLGASGCRMAGPGEFTRRAFTAGKMDLAQAEAVADLIAASSQAAHKLAFSQMRGHYSQRLRELRQQIIELGALMELELDFSEEEVEFADRGRLELLAREALGQIERLADSFRLGNAFKRGIPVAIVGPVNSGKSTLLNALLGEERALVSDIPGTTRDTVEEVLVLGGVAYRFIDTAGLRQTAETVEKMGIERSLEQIGKASIVLVLLDASAPVAELAGVVADVRARLREDCRAIWVRSKSDIGGPDFASELGLEGLISISAKTGEGLTELRDAICAGARQDLLAADGLLVTNQRHQQALLRAAEDLRRFLDGLSTALPTDLLAEDLRSATAALGTIFGEVTPDDVLGEVFGRFCIGK
ncbi:MAG: tRNA uridine-5-carboxymethylaminomethyl(34) synthesis GTPase MnmE [Bacteroidales bacterium]|nr:tRNA uridine-5-carboxymethylaminomethyl(34) synthesis GTPase MnmE [Bacteroidales bacterium]